jgi:16S rRNA (cytosine967-C5)-methyltransferase
LTPSARLNAAAEVLDLIAQTRAPAESVLRRWGQGHRFAGSGDRRAITDRVYRCLRDRARLAWAMGDSDGRALVLGSLRFDDEAELFEIEALFEAGGYGPGPLTDDERTRLTKAPETAPAWVEAGLPDFAAADLEAVFGDDWMAEAQALIGARAPLDLRVNGGRASLDAVKAELQSEGLAPEATPWSVWGLRLPGSPPTDVQALTAFREGRIEIQDEGSQLAAWLAGAEPGMTVVDYCAGGGGKTLALAQAMGLAPSGLSDAHKSPFPLDGGRVGDGGVHADGAAEGAGGEGVQPHAPPSARSARTPPSQPFLHRGGRALEGALIACDVDQLRLDAIGPRLARAGLTVDLRRLGPEGQGVDDLTAAADLVLVDAPCSGSGTWRRHPENAWRTTSTEVSNLHVLQREVLARAARLVRPGGRLAYVTCSVLARENEATATAFEAAHPNFRPRPITDALGAPQFTDEARARLAALAAGGHTLRLTPRLTGTDGFFIALYERTS